MSAQCIAIVPAAGLGTRMQNDTPKQYLIVGDRAVLTHSLEILLSHPNVLQVIVVLHPEDELFTTVQADLMVTVPNTVYKLHACVGGDERVDSVLAGLIYAQQMSPPTSFVLIHDAARPCLMHSDIDMLLVHMSAQPQQGVLLAVPATDTIKQAHPTQRKVKTTLNRNHIWSAYTPQGAQIGVLKNAIMNGLARGISLTDEASALEAADVPVQIIAGRKDNIKITHPEDLALAAFYLTEQGRL